MIEKRRPMEDSSDSLLAMITRKKWRPMSGVKLADGDRVRVPWTPTATNPDPWREGTLDLAAGRVRLDSGGAPVKLNKSSMQVLR